MTTRKSVGAKSTRKHAGARSDAVPATQQGAAAGPNFNVSEAATFLRISKHMVRDAMRQGSLAYVRITKRRVILERAELERYVAARRVGEGR